ncbi:MAG: hypothetical protein V1799_05390 [bacterium]
MERTSKEVSHTVRRGGCRCPWFLFRWITLSCSLLMPVLLASQSADLLLVEKTEKLVVYNSFQQSQKKQPAALQPFRPIQILNAYELLSDGITPCMKVEIEGEIYYLLLEKKGELADLKMLGFTKLYSSKKVFSDTVEILASKRMAIRHVLTKQRIALKAGERCVRYFAEKALMYVKKLGTPSLFGWMECPPGREGTWWSRLLTREKFSALPLLAQKRITGKMKEINTKLLQLHGMFTAETAKKISPPQWQVRQTDSTLTLSLLPEGAAAEYRQSMSALLGTVQTYLLGTGYDAVLKSNSIEIKCR